VDVGGRRKGFDLALVDEYQVLELASRLDCAAVTAFVEKARPSIVAIDSPRCCAPDGQTTRPGERVVATMICGIRWTPDAAKVQAGGYYAWIVEGLRLYEALSEPGDRTLEVIEVFPTASWTRWHGRRGQQGRAAWTRQSLAQLGLAGVPARTNQDQRDAIAAAVTARQYERGRTEQMGEIVVPAP
jgi:predicted nuclease with RNAse H fold